MLLSQYVERELREKKMGKRKATPMLIVDDGPDRDLTVAAFELVKATMLSGDAERALERLRACAIEYSSECLRALRGKRGRR